MEVQTLISLEKRPRKYAMEIINSRTLQERKELLAKVPLHFRDLVEKHVRNYWVLRKSRSD